MIPAEVHLLEISLSLSWLNAAAAATTAAVHIMEHSIAFLWDSSVLSLWSSEEAKMYSSALQESQS